VIERHDGRLLRHGVGRAVVVLGLGLLLGSAGRLDTDALGLFFGEATIVFCEPFLHGLQCLLENDLGLGDDVVDVGQVGRPDRIEVPLTSVPALGHTERSVGQERFASERACPDLDLDDRDFGVGIVEVRPLRPPTHREVIALDVEAIDLRSIQLGCSVGLEQQARRIASEIVEKHHVDDPTIRQTDALIRHLLPGIESLETNLRNGSGVVDLHLFAPDHDGVGELGEHLLHFLRIEIRIGGHPLEVRVARGVTHVRQDVREQTFLGIREGLVAGPTIELVDARRFRRLLELSRQMFGESLPLPDRIRLQHLPGLDGLTVEDLRHRAHGIPVTRRVTTVDNLLLQEMRSKLRQPESIDAHSHSDQVESVRVTVATLDVQVPRQPDDPAPLAAEELLGVLTPQHRVVGQLTSAIRVLILEMAVLHIEIVNHSGADRRMNRAVRESRHLVRDLDDALESLAEMLAGLFDPEEGLRVDALLLHLLGLHGLRSLVDLQLRADVGILLVGTELVPQVRVLVHRDSAALQKSGSGDDLGNDTVLLGLDEHATVLHGDGHPRDLVADLGDVAVPVHAPQRLESAPSLMDFLLVRLMEELQRFRVESRLRQTEHGLIQTHALDLGHWELRSLDLLEVALFVVLDSLFAEVVAVIDVDSRSSTTGTSFPLSAVAQCDRSQVKSLDSSRELDAPLHAGVDHGVDIVDGDAGLRHVRGYDTLGSAVVLEHQGLIFRGHLAVKRQDFRVDLGGLEILDGLLDLALSGLEDEDVATLLEKLHGVTQEIVLGGTHLDRELPAGDVDDRSVVEILRELVSLDSGAHEHQLEVDALLQLQLTPGHQDLHVEVPLVGLVEHEHVVLERRPIRPLLTHEHAHLREPIGAEEAAGPGAVVTLQRSTIADRATDLLAELERDALRDRAGREAARLCHQHGGTLLQEELGHLRGLAGTGLGHDDRDLIALDRRDDLILEGVDGKGAVHDTLQLLHPRLEGKGWFLVSQ
jgi:hypothetical protein